MAPRLITGALVVRGPELATIEDFLGSRRRGLLITGDRGMGKSRLLRSALADSERDAVMIRGAGRDGAPFSSLAGRQLYGSGELLHRLDQLLEEVAAGTADEVPAALRRLEELSRRHGSAGIVVAIDDLEALDEASARLLGEGLRRDHWRYLITSDGRPGEPVDALDSLSIKALSDDEARELLLDHADGDVCWQAVQTLNRIARGNPGLVLDLADQVPPEALSGLEPMPLPLPTGAGCARILGDRSAGLGDRELAALAVFAFHDQLPRTMIETSFGAGTVDTLLRRDVIMVDEDRVRPHPVTALLAWSRLSAGQRRRLHADLCFAFTDVEPTWAAYHRRLAGGSAEARPDRLVGGLLAEGRVEEAHRIVQAVAADPAEAVVELCRAELELALGYVERALAAVRRGLARQPEPAQDLALRLIGLFAAQVADVDCADLAPDTARWNELDAGVRSGLAPLLIHHLVRVDLTDSAAEAIDALAAAARTAEDRAALAAVRTDWALDREAPASESLRSALHRLADAVRTVPGLGPIWLATELMAVGDLALCRRLIDAARANRAQAQPQTRVILDLLLARLELTDGRYSRALPLLVEVARRQPALRSVAALGSRIRAEAGLGILTEDPQALLARTQFAPERIRATVEADLGHALLVAGRWTEAAYSLASALTRSRMIDHGGTAALADLVEAYQLAGMTDLAARAADEHRDRVLDAGTDQTLPIMVRIDALLADPGDAERLFGVALGATGLRPRDLDRARTLISFGRWLLSAGRGEEGRTVLGQATHLMRSLGLDGWVDHIERISRTAPVRRPAGLHDQLLEITDDDRELVGHLMSGHTYDQIAARMYLSRRTVASRLKSVYHRLGVANRAELVGLISVSSPGWVRSAS
ncbi:AAA family ATPase [Microlunatus sp. GCM10028923]|uniref:helix-turn-helix transcriptional regulator n=1 Tax=Microlunatus sp. GCM10028923 TaxID=3273400 RepID=UPI00361466DC